MSRIVGILLAAGASRRFGAPKLLSPLPDGTPVGLASARSLIRALPESVAVVRPGEDRLSPLLVQVGCRLVTNTDADLGLGSSLAAGVREARGADGWVIALADMPWVTTASFAAVAERLRHGASIVAPVYRGRRGHPVGLASQWFTDLTRLAGDRGARELIDGNPEAFTALATDDAGVIRDVDVPADLLA